MFIPKNKYGSPNIGKNVRFGGNGEDVNWGSESYLITIGDDTTISFDCAFVTHDAATRVVRNLPDGNPETVIFAPINVGKNCFIGCRTVVLMGVTIGDNCIIGAGSVVNKDIPANSVAAGVPCKVICTLDEYIKKHENDFMYIGSKSLEEKKKILLQKFKKE